MEKYQKQIKPILFLAWPAIIQEAMNVVVSYVDTAMVGALGANASAAVGLTSTVCWLVTSIAIAFGVGILAVCAQAVGANNHEKVQRTGQQALFFTLIVGLTLTVICVAIAPYLPGWLNGAPAIRKDATTYFLIISIPLLFRCTVLILSSLLRGVSDMKTPMLISLYMNLINIVFNFFLIYPTRQIFGITVYGANMGVAGAAIATAISFVAGGVMMFVRYYRNPTFNFKKTGFHFYPAEFKECLSIGIPVVLERSVICLGQVTFSSLIAKLGVVQFAAHTIAIQADNAIGQKSEHRVKEVTYLICAMTVLLMIICGGLLFIFAENLMGIFTPDPEVIRLGA